MSPQERFEPDDPREWLNRARSNLARAHAVKGVEGIYCEDICFDAQQAAEKAIKAVLLSRQIDFPKVHDIAKLLTLVRQTGVAVPGEIADATGLSQYAVATRYPGHGEPVTEEDCDAAIASAEAVVRWASSLAREAPSDPGGLPTPKAHKVGSYGLAPVTMTAKHGGSRARSPGSSRRVYGIDFSGGARAGRKVWVARGRLGDEGLAIEECRRGADLPGGSVARDQCLTALRGLIEREPDAVFGLDFPFGLPKELLQEETWEQFALAFGCRHGTAEAFRQWCKEWGRPERKRLTDVETKTPFSPYQLWLYRQTFHGIRDVLAPLVRNGTARVLPMQEPASGKAWVLEICPASTLKRLSQELETELGIPFKGKKPGRRKGREHILAALEERCGVHIGDRALRKALLDDSEGDALDSVIAALGVARALRHREFPRPEWKAIYALEGYVYA